MHGQNPISGYSKGARGLSVQSRVNGIFTAASISPSSSWRQRPNRYTIRAGRNLPDKEFRSVSLFCFQKSRTLPWLAPIHLRGDLSDLVETGRGQMIARLHHLQDRAEFLESHTFP